ncbi:MAG: hypothetical protein ABI790_05415, partial [Betaproteobacteria bacterium]
GLRTRFKGLVTGTSRFYVMPIDSVPQYSANAAYVDITITSDSDAYLQDFEFVNPTGLALIAYQVDGERHQRWITNKSDTWDSLFTARMSDYTNPIATYTATGATTSFTSEAVDLGSLLTGDWTLTANTTFLSGSGSLALQTSPDGSAWTSRASPYTGVSRYLRVYLSDAFGGAFHVTAPPSISLAAVSRKESDGPVTSNAGSAKTISLAGKYFKVVRITITPRGTVARMSTLNNIVLSLSGANSFDVYLFDQAGTQVASDFNWDFEGV